ncbi:melibiase [Paludibacter sp. 221]|uniref:alpha-galactosidase n=1 Tax=Paludibacter sp. 221 TaxID=2302939 RepID=UPI0013D4CA16|nr:alpha-galactosidase [Paludibacter sp. 221]NDV46726.1 melibiase [Paludibacter sp. 221]
MKKIILSLFILLPVVLLAQNRIPLSELNLSMMTTGWSSAKANRSIDGNPLTMGGKVYRNGVGTHADSKMMIALEGRAARFTALVGVDDEVTSAGSVVFRITADDKEVFKSPLMRKGDKPKKVNINLNGVQTLVLEALSGGDGISNDHADWAEAYFDMKEGKPVAVSSRRLIEISTDNNLLLLSVDAEDNLMQQYIGRKAGLEVTFASGVQKEQAYSTIQSGKQIVYWGEPALHVVHHNGHTSTMLKYVEHKTTKVDDNITLTYIKLKDSVYPLYTELYYKAYAKQNVIEQWTEVYHNEEGDVTIKQAASSALTLRSRTRNYWLTQFTGDWMNEFNVDEYPLTVGSKVIENRWGITSSNGRQPHFMITLNEQATETSGEVLAGTLAWSGNYQLKFELTTYGYLSVVSGTNPWSADYTLPAGRRYITPSLIYTYSTQGKGEASRNLHRWARAYGIRDGETELRTIFNNWEATGMNTADNVIIPFLQPAHDLGFELFLLDDGWFGLPDKARVLGEWNPTPKMHPDGMKPLIEAAGKVGIDFGLWVEMEMANPEAHLVTEHPEWLLTDPQRTPHLQRGQYVLDLTNPQVQDFCIGAFDNILKSNPGITFVKWDCNSPFHNPYSQYLGDKQQHLWYEYTRGLYRIFSESVRLNPDLQMMLCAAGGGRCDYGAMRYFHEFWTSDNTNPLKRVFVQWGASHVFPAKTHGAHVTHMGHQPFKFAFDVAMSGCLGMDANPLKMTEEEKKITKRSLEAYKTKLRPVVQLGDLYRLVSPYETSRSVVSYVENDKKEKAVVFVYQVRDSSEGLNVALQGLNPDLNYTIDEVNIDSADAAACIQNGKTLSGKELMEKGLDFNCKKRFDSASVYLYVK